MVRLLNSEILLGSKGLNFVSLVGRGESPTVGDTLLRPGGDETFGLCGGHHGWMMITLGIEGRRS